MSAEYSVVEVQQRAMRSNVSDRTRGMLLNLAEREAFEKFAQGMGISTTKHGEAMLYESGVPWCAWLAWKARSELTAQGDPVAWQINATQSSRGWEPCTQECYEDTLRTGRYMGLHTGTRDVEVRALYTHLAQPAQAVDVGAIREVIAEMRTWQSYCAQTYADTLTRAIGN